MLSRGLNGKETGEGTGICPRDVLCIDCVRVLNGSFSASFLVGDPDGCVGGGGGRNSKDEMLGECEKRKRMKACRGSGWRVVENAE